MARQHDIICAYKQNPNTRNLMKAVHYKRYGDPNVLEIITVDKPKLKPGHVLIQNHASSVNPIDWKIRKGMLRPISGFTPPSRCGSDFAGVIVDTHPSVKRYRAGDRVYGFVNPLKGGAYAQYLVADQNVLATIPASLDFEHAAVIPLAGLTAFESLTRIGKTQPGNRVVINGCSGGVGTFAVQIAKALGAHVIGICSEKKHAVAMELGADEVIDYHQPDHLQTLRDINVFFDTVSSQSLAKIKHTLTKNGTYIYTLPEIKSFVKEPFCNLFNNQKSLPILVKPNGQSLETLSQWVESGQLSPKIEAFYHLNNIQEAQKQSENNRVTGKIAINTSY